MDSQICALTERVARLEKSNRAMKVIVAVALLATAAMTSTPQLLAKTKKPATRMASLEADTITTREVFLLNGANQVAAVLGTSGSSAGLVFVDPAGKWLAALGSSQNGTKSTAGLALYDGNAVLPGSGAIRAAVGVSAQGAGLTALDGAGNPVLVSGVSADGASAGSVVMDSSGISRAGLGNAANGAGLFVNDSNNVTRYVAGVNPGGTQAGSLTFDATGKPQLALGGNGDASGAGMLALDATGQDRLDAGFSSAAGGGVLVKDAGGNVTWFAPEPAGE